MHDFLHVILPGRVVYRFSGVRGNLPVLTVTRTRTRTHDRPVLTNESAHSCRTKNQL